MLLRRGSRGSSVTSLQSSLNAALSPSPRLTADGIFGAKTEAAVRQFQQQARIGVDGIAGPVTQARLARQSSPAATPAGQGNLRLGSRGDQVRQLQRDLNSRSPHGPRLSTDGVFGSRTQQAVMNFQRHNRLTVDGIAGPQTRAALSAAPQIPAGTTPTPAITPTPVGGGGGGTPGSIARPTYDNIESVYGDPQDYSYVTRISPPFPLYYGGAAVSSVSVHRLVSQSLSNALSGVLSHYGLAEIERLRINHNYGGSLNKRRMRNGTSWSTHSWGVAIDLNHSENQLSWGADRALFAQPEYRPLIDIFERHGWYNLGRHAGYDYMHFQAVRI